MIQYLSLILIYKIHLRLTICPGLKYLNIFRYVTVIDEFPSFYYCIIVSLKKRPRIVRKQGYLRKRIKSV